MSATGTSDRAKAGPKKEQLCDGLTFQLTEHRCDVHHRAAHGAGRVKTFTDGHKVDAQPSQFFNHGLSVKGSAVESAGPAIEAWLKENGVI